MKCINEIATEGKEKGADGHTALLSGKIYRISGSIRAVLNA